MSCIMAMAAAACRPSPADVAEPPPPVQVGRDFAAASLGVDPFIGTDGRGGTWPGATTPWGLVTVSAQSNVERGYRWRDREIIGLGHLHVSGSPPDFGVVRLLPLAADERRDPDDVRYTKAWEWAHPGTYAVGLRGAAVAAEVCAAPRSALHRYRTSTRRSLDVLLDAGHSIGAMGNTTTASYLALDSAGIGGWVVAGAMGGLGRQPRIYYHVAFDAPPQQVTLLTDGVAAGPPRDWRRARIGGLGKPRSQWSDASAPTVAARRVAARLRFASRTDTAGVRLRVGLSPTSIDAARMNAEFEIPTFDIAACAARATDTWRGVLDRIRVRTPDTAFATVVRTALYHATLHPSVWSDAGATAPRVTVLSLWDTWRTVDPLMTLIAPDVQRRTTATILALAAERGSLPLWDLYGQETNNMVGDPGAVVLAAGTLDGLVGDPRAALAALRRSAEHPTRWPAADAPSKGRVGIADYVRLGYVAEPSAREKPGVAARIDVRLHGVPTLSLEQAGVYGAVETTLEYVYADHCIARVASLVGEAALAARYATRAAGWRRLWDSSTSDTIAGLVVPGFFRSRHADGTWVAPFRPMRGGHEQRGFVEGDAWQARWFVPHEPDALTQLMGGDATTLRALRAYVDHGGVTLANEPDFYAPWLLMRLGRNAADDQRRLVRLTRRTFRRGVDGLPGQDDAGALSGWLTWTALGVLPLDPCGGHVVLARPLVERAEVRLGAGANAPTLVIEARGASDSNAVVTTVRWNGRPVVGELESAALRQGGVLRFDLRVRPAPTR